MSVTPEHRGGDAAPGIAGAARSAGGWQWAALAIVIAGLVMVPVFAVLVMAMAPSGDTLAHLISTSLPRYLGNTLILMAGAGILAACAGAGAAWLVVMYRFPGARALEWLLLLPLAVPAYVGAYALIDFLQYSGPVQTGLRGLMGWQSARDYAFPEIRSRWAASVVLAAALYPYVYLLARAAFREQSGAAYEVARALGAGPFALFWRVGLPLARPAIAAGTALVMMEVVADYGVTSHFGVQTLTTGIFSVWLTEGNRPAAAQLSVAILGLVLALVAVERLGRARARFHQSARGARRVQPIRLHGLPAAVASLLCLLPFALGFVLPVAVMSAHALANPEAWVAPGLGPALVNTLLTGGIAALVTVLAVLLLVYGARLSSSPLPARLLPLTSLGYAAPGAVLAVGLLFPLAGLDHLIAGWREALFGTPPRLLLTGTAAALIYAYAVRFFAVAQGAVDTAFGRVPPSLAMAARSLGQGSAPVLGRVYLPLMKGSLGTALLMVFVDCSKELPATLLLRPFNFETLATRVHEKASLENLGDASPGALLVIGVGLVAVLLLARANR